MRSMKRRNETDGWAAIDAGFRAKNVRAQKFADCGKRTSAPPRGKNRDKVEMGAKATKTRNSYLLELLDGTLVDTAALVDQMTCYVCERETRGTDRGSWEAYRWWWTCQNRRGR
jgi:hypothetical protein